MRRKDTVNVHIYPVQNTYLEMRGEISVAPLPLISIAVTLGIVQIESGKWERFWLCRSSLPERSAAESTGAERRTWLILNCLKTNTRRRKTTKKIRENQESIKIDR